MRTVLAALGLALLVACVPMEYVQPDCRDIAAGCPDAAPPQDVQGGEVATDAPTVETGAPDAPGPEASTADVAAVGDATQGDGPDVPAVDAGADGAADGGGDAPVPCDGGSFVPGDGAPVPEMLAIRIEVRSALGAWEPMIEAPPSAMSCGYSFSSHWITVHGAFARGSVDGDTNPGGYIGYVDLDGSRGQTQDRTLQIGEGYITPGGLGTRRINARLVVRTAPPCSRVIEIVAYGCVAG